jgi:glucan phosphorylase
VSLAPVSGGAAGLAGRAAGPSAATGASLPPSLAGLERLARNLAWCTDPEATALLEGLAPERWDALDHNPLAVLSSLTADEVAALAGDANVVARLASVLARLDAHLAAPSADAADGGPTAARPIAYFCAEFGLHESLPIYNGGLGVLAGDHLKAANDLRLPLVAVGLFYRRGYLRQRVSVRGEQVPCPSRTTRGASRRARARRRRHAGHGPQRLEPHARSSRGASRSRILYLLDADVPDNRPEDRSVTHRLYPGDAEARLRQEIVLGKGGMRLLARLGIDPAVVHMNEGHAAFAPLERVSRLVHQAGLTFDEAAAMVRASTVFTTHTPVPAGHDRFPEPLLRRYFADAAAWLGIPWERFLALGRVGAETEFNMTVLGIRMSAFRNAVSRLHGEVSRRLLGASWPGLLPDEVPVTHVTNGVHLATWTAPALGRVLGAGDRSVVAEDFSSRAADVDLDALWAARTSARRTTLAAVHRHVREACRERSEPASAAERLTSGFTEDVLTIGFARRFARKRADLLLRDVRRLEALVHRADHPVRFLFAGKAHPSDRAGQEVLRRVVEASRRDGLAGRLLFLDDYDIGLARELVRGVDVWVNTPIRGLEASGTSGMKAAANGALHLPSATAGGTRPRRRTAS